MNHKDAIPSSFPRSNLTKDGRPPSGEQSLAEPVTTVTLRGQGNWNGIPVPGLAFQGDWSSNFSRFEQTVPLEVEVGDDKVVIEGLVLQYNDTQAVALMGSFCIEDFGCTSNGLLVGPRRRPDQVAVNLIIQDDWGFTFRLPPT